MADLALDDDLQLVIPMRLIDGPELVIQRMRIRLATHLGEWLLDELVGLPYIDWADAVPPPLLDIETRILDTLARTPGVLRIEDFDVTLSDSGTYSILGTVLLETTTPDVGVQLSVDVVRGVVRVRSVTN